MPTYGYRCTACGTEFDVWQRMSDEPGAACPACGRPGKRLIFPAGIVFKGSGFYKTDSRGSSSSTVSSPSAPSTPATNGAGSTPPKPTPSTTPATAPSPGGGD